MLAALVSDAKSFAKRSPVGACPAAIFDHSDVTACDLFLLFILVSGEERRHELWLERTGWEQDDRLAADTLFLAFLYRRCGSL
jgi:hypothetical protein